MTGLGFIYCPRATSLQSKKRSSTKVFALIGRGQMGSLIADILREDTKTEVLVLHSRSSQDDWAECERADLLIDFSNASAVKGIFQLACRLKKPLIVGTTGWEQMAKELKKMVLTSQIACLHSPNFSWGIYALRRALVQIADLGPFLPISDLALREVHGKGKLDTPSGTAKQLAQDAKGLFAFETIDISSHRFGNDPGQHILTLDGSEEMIELRHTAKSRRCFALGAIASCHWLLDQRPSWYTMDDMAQMLVAHHSNADKFHPLRH